MNEMRVPEPEQVAATPPPSRPADPLRRWTVVILVFCVMLFGWTLIADRLTPYTSDVSVRTFVVRTVPEVSGKVIEVGVRDNQIVRTGDLLYRIDPTSFRIAVERAEAKLAAAGQAIGASTAAVDAAQAQLVEEIAQRSNVREQAGRVFELVRLGIYPRARGDQARSQLDEAEAQVKRAQATLSCRAFAANAVRLHTLAFNLGNFMHTLAMPRTTEPWSLTSLRDKLIKIGTKVVSHGRYVTFQLAEVAVSRQMFADILSLIARLRAPPAPA